MLARKGSNFDVASRGRNRALPRQRRHPRPAVLRQHDQEGKGHRLRLSGGGAAVCLRQRGGARKAGARRRPARASSAASWCPARAPTGRCRASSAARPEMAVELLHQARDARPRSLRRVVPCRLAADRSRPMGPRGRRRRRACSRCSPRPTSTCAWSISAAASRRSIAARSPAIERYAQAVTDALTRHFGNRPARDHRRAGPLAGRRCRGRSRARSC